MATGYGTSIQVTNIVELIAIAGQQSEVEGVEMIFDDIEYHDRSVVTRSNGKIVRTALEEYQLQPCSLIPNLWGSPWQGKGTIGSTDPVVRQRSIDLCKYALDAAVEIGCPYLGIWPGQDGFDYYFEVDHLHAWEYWVRGLQEISDHNPNIRIGLEPKPDEPRAYSFISTVPKTLLLIQSVGRDNLGVCLDVGHCLYVHENLGEMVALMHAKENRLFHCHMNDNYNNADLDMILGAVHTLEFIEFFYWLRKTGYKGYLSVDLFAYRTDPARSIGSAVRWMKAIDHFIDRVGIDRITALIQDGDPVVTTDFFRQQLLGE
jgi:xylose isomerase